MFSRYIIHTVGPSYDEDRDEEAAALLASCYESSLKLAVKHDLKHVVRVFNIYASHLINTFDKAFPCISTGLYGYPPKAAARVALDTVRRFCESEEGAKVPLFLPREFACLRVLA